MLPKQTFWNTKKTVVCRNMHCQHIFWRLSCAPSLSSFGHDASVWEKYHGAVSSVVLPSSRVQSSLQAKSSFSTCPKGSIGSLASDSNSRIWATFPPKYQNSRTLPHNLHKKSLRFPEGRTSKKGSHVSFIWCLILGVIYARWQNCYKHYSKLM